MTFTSNNAHQVIRSQNAQPSIAIFWSEILHYHAARIQALVLLGESRGHAIYPFALRTGSPNLPAMSIHEVPQSLIRVLSPDSEIAGPYTALSERHVMDFLVRHSPEVVAIPGYSDPVALTALHWCRRHRRGAVLMSESQAGDYKRSSMREHIKRQLVKSYDAALVGGSPHVKYAKTLGIPAERIFIGYDAVDNDFWTSQAALVRSNPDAWRNRLGLPSRFFMTASRLVPKKNVAGLLHAYAMYVSRTSSDPWPLLIAGDGTLRNSLVSLVSELGMSDLVHFKGYLSATDMAPLYALASVFILASGFYEQWGLVVNEAMACGTPVLVSEVCGSAEDLIVPGETGFKFDPKNEDALAELLRLCSEGMLDLTHMGVSAQRRVAQFHPSVFAENLLLAAQAAIKNARSRRLDLASQAYVAGARRILRKGTVKIE